MKTITVTQTRKNIFKILDEIVNSQEPIQITGKRSSAVLIGEEDWNSIQETLYLLSISGMRESIRDGLNAPLEKTRR